MPVACCLHLTGAGNHAENHFYGIHELASTVHALNNNQQAQLYLDGATVISQKLYRENLHDFGGQKN